MTAKSPRDERYYGFHDLEVHTVTDHPTVGRGLARIARGLGWVPNPGPSDDGEPLRLEILTRGVDEKADDEAVVGETYGGLETWRFRDRFTLRGPGVVAFLRPAAGLARALVSPTAWEAEDGPPEVDLNLVYLSLMILLRHRGIHSMHAAGLVRSDKGLLVVATAGAGKSTLALALLEAGWKALSDDSVVLRPMGDGVEALALRRDLYLEPPALEGFPGLTERWQDPPLGASSKRWLALEAAFPGQSVERCKPRWVLFPRAVDRAVSELRPLPSHHALGKLIGQSFLVFLEPTRASAQIEALRRLVQQSRCYELLTGRDLLEDPTAVARRVAEALEDDLDAAQS